jgi:hypothetical protein
LRRTVFDLLSIDLAVQLGNLGSFDREKRSTGTHK